MNKWDLYDNKFKNTGIVINENDEIPDDKYHYSINIWIINSKKQVLLIRNTLNYNLHYPGFYEERKWHDRFLIIDDLFVFLVLVFGIVLMVMY